MSAPVRNVQGMDDLSDEDIALLRFERLWWRERGAKEKAIRSAFGISGTAYYQRLRAVVLKPAAVAVDPVTVHRLQRVMRRAG